MTFILHLIRWQGLQHVCQSSPPRLISFWVYLKDSKIRQLCALCQPVYLLFFWCTTQRYSPFASDWLCTHVIAFCLRWQIATGNWFSLLGSQFSVLSSPTTSYPSGIHLLENSMSPTSSRWQSQTICWNKLEIEWNCQKHFAHFIIFIFFFQLFFCQAKFFSRFCRVFSGYTKEMSTIKA